MSFWRRLSGWRARTFWREIQTARWRYSLHVDSLRLLVGIFHILDSIFGLEVRRIWHKVVCHVQGYILCNLNPNSHFKTVHKTSTLLLAWPAADLALMDLGLGNLKGLLPWFPQRLHHLCNIRPRRPYFLSSKSSLGSAASLLLALTRRSLPSLSSSLLLMLLYL